MNTPSRKILVTGVAGFLGSHLAEKLIEMNKYISSLKDKYQITIQNYEN